ncbi:MAG: nitroreductase family protein [Desulfarculales bacterium]|jgi:nitroreductase|nr:nitroreductase family protein [Desulfarculales bacterium]
MNDLQTFCNILRSRRSLRDFADKRVSEEILLCLRQAALSAPVAGGRQDVSCLFINDKSVIATWAAKARLAWQEKLDNSSAFIKEEMGAYIRNFIWFSHAPVLAVMTVKQAPLFWTGLMQEKAALIFGGETSAAMAAQNLLLAAHMAGLAACPLSGPLIIADDIKRDLNLTRRTIVLLIALGWPQERLR